MHRWGAFLSNHQNIIYTRNPPLYYRTYPTATSPPSPWRRLTLSVCPLHSFEVIKSIYKYRKKKQQRNKTLEETSPPQSRYSGEGTKVKQRSDSGVSQPVRSVYTLERLLQVNVNTSQKEKPTFSWPAINLLLA